MLIPKNTRKEIYSAIFKVSPANTLSFGYACLLSLVSECVGGAGASSKE